MRLAVAALLLGLASLARVLAALLVAENRLEEAVCALAEARRIRPNLSLREIRGIVGGRYATALQEIWKR